MEKSRGAVATLVAGTLALALGLITPVVSLLLPSVAHADPGMYERQYPFNNGEQTSYLEAYRTDQADGYPLWCVQSGIVAPTGVQGVTPDTLTESKMWGPAELDLTTPQAAWLLQYVGKDMPAKTAGAVSYLIHANFEKPGIPGSAPANPQDTVNNMVREIKSKYPDVHELAVELVVKARKSAVSGYEVGAVTGDGKRTGDIHGIGLTGSDGQYLAGHPVTVVLSGPAVFTDTKTNTWKGTTQTSPIALKWEATGNGSVGSTITFGGMHRNDLSTYDGARDGHTYQTVLTYGGKNAPSEVEKKGPSWKVIYDFQPIVKSNVPDKTVHKGDVLRDHLTVSADPSYGSGEWFKIPGTDKFIPVKFEGTAYLVGHLPPAGEQKEIPSDAKIIGTTSFVADRGPGEYDAKLDKAAVEPGFVTWVWKIVKANQPEEFRQYIHGDYSEKYGIPIETHSVKHEAKVDSQLSVRQTKSGSYLVDDLWVEGMPDDHPDFQGTDRFEADVKVMTQTLWFFPDGVEVSDKNLDKAEKIADTTVPAKNGFHPSVGSTKFKMKLRDGATGDLNAPENLLPGTYVFQTSFPGDARVKAFASSVTDVKEQYRVTPKPLKVVTKAVPEVMVGEKAHDTAIVTGTVPSGSTVEFELFKAMGDKKECTPANRVWTSPKVKLDGAGEYDSAERVMNEAGTFYWVETVRGAEGETLHRGECGLENETVRVKEKPSEKLAYTGADGVILLGGVATVLAGGGLGALAYRKRFAR